MMRYSWSLRSLGNTVSMETKPVRLVQRRGLIFYSGLAILCLVFLLVSGCQLVQGGNWESIGPEQGGIILSIATDPFHSHLIYVGTSTGVVYVASADTGPNLVPGVGIPRNVLITSLLADPQHEGTIYAGTSAGLYVSTDRSATWHARGTGFPSGETMDALVYLKDVQGRDILMAGSVTHGVFISQDQGNTWQPSSRGLPANANINALLFEPTTQTMYVAVDTVGVFASSNLGATWLPSSTGLPKEVHALTELAKNGINPTGVTLYAGTDQGVYATTDNGTNWHFSGTGPRQPVYSLATYVTATIPGWIYAGTETDVIRSPDGGRTWATIARGLSNRVLAIASVPATPSSSAPLYVIFAGSENLWRFPPEQGGGSSILSLLVEGAVLLLMFGLLFYLVRRTRGRWGSPAAPAPVAAAAETVGTAATRGAADPPRDSGDVTIKASMNGHRPVMPTASSHQTTSSDPHTNRAGQSNYGPGGKTRGNKNNNNNGSSRGKKKQ